MFHQLYQFYEKYQEKSITKRRFGYQLLVSLLEQHRQHALFDIQTIGCSTEQRNIYLIKIGKGKTKVLLWSQMHGDEATATMALMDICNFFATTADEFTELRNHILATCTLYIVPMLNPDGAEAWSRYTALGIDMNRDALALQTPEGRLLKSLVMDLQPAFGFNLHDQGRRYSAGNTGNLATVSFLATAYNEAQDINPVRHRAMQLIVQLNRLLQAYIPDAVGKWPADFEPRAFGDNIQKWGTSLVLIESGGYKNDPEKQYIRQLNFIAILKALASIATGEYQKEDIQPYDSIPVNSKVIYDLIIRNLRIAPDCTVDLAINRDETSVPQSDTFRETSSIEEIGDMSVFFGTDEIDATGLHLADGQTLRLGMPANLDLYNAEGLQYRIVNGVATRMAI